MRAPLSLVNTSTDGHRYRYVRFTWIGRAVAVNRRTMLARGARRAMTSRAYQAFVAELAYTICEQIPVRQRMDGQVAVSYRQISRHDVDALSKPLLDAIEASGLVANDRQVVTLEVRREWKRKMGQLDRLEVEVREVGG